MEIIVRSIIIGDAKAITYLSAQLGYPLAEDQIRQNIAAVLSRDHLNAFVALHEKKLVGWIGIAQTFMLESLPYCEINGLVIDEEYRGKGVGRLLINQTKVWAKEKGFNKLKLRCNVIREDAHQFYQHLGFIATKKQTNFELPI